MNKNMGRQITIVKILFFVSSCSTKTETSNFQVTDSIEKLSKVDSEKSELSFQDNFPDFVKATKLPDSLVIDADNVITGDFNADGEDDFASLVANQKNGLRGVLIIHKGEKHEYFVFGAGQEIYEMTNLNRIDIFKKYPKVQDVPPNVVDSVTGEIIGYDYTKIFRLIGAGIYMHVDEASGGGVLFWTGEKYDWFRID
jgi:hypothetical protein